MWTTKSPASLRLAAALVIAVGIAVIVPGWLYLREHAPGNMGNGFLVGGLVALAAFGVTLWRSARHPDRTTIAERAWTSQGDERDDAVLTSALAVVGVTALPLTGAAAIALALGRDTAMIMALLLIAELLVGVVAFTVQARRR
jgi:drug/metabolite transporter (DMT)-like permease